MSAALESFLYAGFRQQMIHLISILTHYDVPFCWPLANIKRVVSGKH
jgi:hypothetical protein